MNFGNATPEEEYACRALCLVNGGIPDAIVTPYEPKRLIGRHFFYVEPAGRCCPAWTVFLYDVRAAVDLIRKENAKACKNPDVAA